MQKKDRLRQFVAFKKFKNSSLTAQTLIYKIIAKTNNHTTLKTSIYNYKTESKQHFKSQ